MVLSVSQIELIRDEIGPDLDFANNTSEVIAGQLGSLEAIYTDPLRGNENVLKTALICWRNRLASMNARSFDITKEGNWLARSQRTKFIMNRVEHYERLLRDKPKGKNATLLSRSAAESTG